jgi:hypothetical protein
VSPDPADRPVDVPWPWLGPRPYVSSFARADLDAIKQRDRRLRRKLIGLINGLLTTKPSERSRKVKDPPGREPRYFVELAEGYGVVYRVVDPPEDFSGSPSVLWIESVISWEHLSAEVEALAPKEDDTGPEG